MRTRSVRVGDVYAFSDEALNRLRSQGTDWTEQVLIVFDMTAHARDEAKVAFYAAAAGSIGQDDETDDSEADRELAEVAWAERERAAEERQPEQYA